MSSIIPLCASAAAIDFHCRTHSPATPRLVAKSQWKQALPSRQQTSPVFPAHAAIAISARNPLKKRPIP
jgi:hypothetical protein